MLSRILICAGIGSLLIATCQSEGERHWSRTTKAPGRKLQDTLDHLSALINDLRTELSVLNSRVRELERRQNDTTRTLDTMGQSILTLEGQGLTLSNGQKKLVAANTIWKNNFKIVDNVFAVLRKKFVFNAAGIGYPLR